jgi:hypothetical protein
MSTFLSDISKREHVGVEQNKVRSIIINTTKTIEFENLINGTA